jgi:hypothetical protein
LIFLSGCSQTSSTPASVHGTVTYKGGGLPGGKIIFIASEGGHYTSEIDKDGKYAARDLPIGHFVVIIDNKFLKGNPAAAANTGKEYQTRGGDPDAMKKKMMERGMIPNTAPQGGASGGEYKEIPSRYEDAKTSTLSVDLVNGDQKKDFELME